MKVPLDLRHPLLANGLQQYEDRKGEETKTSRCLTRAVTAFGAALAPGVGGSSDPTGATYECVEGDPDPGLRPGRICADVVRGGQPWRDRRRGSPPVGTH